MNENNSKLTKKELIKQLESLSNDSDPEVAHIKADELLIKFIADKDIENAFSSITKYYI